MLLRNLRHTLPLFSLPSFLAFESLGLPKTRLLGTMVNQSTRAPTVFVLYFSCTLIVLYGKPRLSYVGSLHYSGG